MNERSASRKINEQAREAIASILLFDISDPDLQSVTVTGCKVSPDRSHCFVYYSAHQGKYEAAAAAFARAERAIRACMTKRLDWRITPALHFVLDSSVDDAIRISSALDAERTALESITAEVEEQDLSEVYKGYTE